MEKPATAPYIAQLSQVGGIMRQNRSASLRITPKRVEYFARQRLRIRPRSGVCDVRSTSVRKWADLKKDSRARLSPGGGAQVQDRVHAVRCRNSMQMMVMQDPLAASATTTPTCSRSWARFFGHDCTSTATLPAPRWIPQQTHATGDIPRPSSTHDPNDNLASSRPSSRHCFQRCSPDQIQQGFRHNGSTITNWV